MKTKSAKAKGRRAASELRESLLEFAPELDEGDIAVTPSGTPGEDLWLSPKARGIYPYAFEVKNVEKLNVWEALDQAESHAEKATDGMNRAPALVFRRNRSKTYVAIELSEFLRVLRI